MINVEDNINSVYTAHSKHNFYARKLISAYVLNHDKIPFNPFTNWDYFMNDMVDRTLTVRANNNLIYLANELWQFGIISNGCYHEIKLAMKNNKNIRFFKLGKTVDEIKEIDITELNFEPELEQEFDMKEFKNEIKNYLKRRRMILVPKFFK